ncbi:hypothetical protein M408DRAFT_333088 [Serendipita vermifera MAFF 305830]|uniref:Uncharacterized protein n=1 Tax=Serendipita vermifera MAFF 305830 TaxID=933852 RepID=A0A0C3ABS1_SERVB|nr:hypothetical protein M408DRAFT_333088 [Serendipita vermifera MAFF 305830]
MSAPTPIPTLPITSATASQAAHIASLTTQVHQLVDKNNAIAAKLEQAQKDARERLHVEIKRSDDIVRQMRDAHEDEMKQVNERMETLRISAVHAQHSIAYAHQVTKHDLKLVENALLHQKNQNLIQAAALVQATGAEDLLKSRLVATKSAHARQVEALVAKLDQAQAELVATQTQASEKDDKIVATLKNQLATLQTSLTTSQEKLAGLERSSAKLKEELTASETAHEKLRSELKVEKRARRETEKELEEVKEQLTARGETESREADAIKQSKRRVRELEVALASEQSRVSELEAAKAELEAERSAWKAEKRKLEKEKEKASLASSSKEKEATVKESTKKKDKEESVKSKKRPRDEEDGEGGGIVIQGAFGKPAVSDEPKKHKKAKLDDSKTEVKAKAPKPAKPTPAPSKPKKTPVTTQSKPLPSSPVHSPSPMSTPQLSEDEDAAPAPAKPKAKPTPTTVAPLLNGTANKKKFKPPAPPKADEASGSDSDDLATKRIKYFGGETKKEPKPSQKVVKKNAESKSKGKATVRDDDEGEVFDLDAVSSATEDEEEEEVRPNPKPKESKVEKPKPKPSKQADAVANKPVVKKPSVTKIDKEKITERENVVPVKPKKRTLNLLGGMTNGTSLGSWGNGLSQNIYNIPSQLSSPEKGGPSVPRATFNFSKP